METIHVSQTLIKVNRLNMLYMPHKPRKKKTLKPWQLNTLRHLGCHIV